MNDNECEHGTAGAHEDPSICSVCVAVRKNNEEMKMPTTTTEETVYSFRSCPFGYLLPPKMCNHPTADKSVVPRPGEPRPPSGCPLRAGPILIRLAALILMLLGSHGCDGEAPQHDRAGCSSPTTSTDTGGGSSGGPAADLPTDCDPTVDGRVLVMGLEAATGQGPTVVYLHGTYEDPWAALAWGGAASAIYANVLADGGVMLLPRGRPWWDPETGPWPWGAVTRNQQLMAEDAALIDAALRCTPGDPDRVSIAGFSAGAIAAGYAGETRPWSAVALWSGGIQPEDRPAMPSSPAVISIHGGTDDLQQLREGAIDFAFYAPDFSVLCDHGGGHVDALGTTGASFLAHSRLGDTHPWQLGLPTWTEQHYCEVMP